MNVRRIMLVAAWTSPQPASVAAARLRLNAITASTSHAAFAAERHSWLTPDSGPLAELVADPSPRQ